MADLALGSENDSTGDQRFFPTSEPGFDGSKLIDVREPRQSETVPFVQGDRERRFHERRAATDIPMAAFGGPNEDPEDDDVRSGDDGSETWFRPGSFLESTWDIGFIGDELLVPVPDIFFDDTQLLDIPLPVRERRQDETLSFVPIVREGLFEFPAAIDIPVIELFDDPDGDPEDEDDEEEVLTAREVKRTPFSLR